MAGACYMDACCRMHSGNTVAEHTLRGPKARGLSCHSLPLDADSTTASLLHIHTCAQVTPGRAVTPTTYSDGMHLP